MMMIGEKSRLGIYLYGKTLRIVEAQTENDSLKVVRIAEAEMDVPFDLNSIDDQTVYPVFVSAINNLVEKKGIMPGPANLALDHRMVIEQIVSFDSDLNDSVLQEHLEWEMNQFLISHRDDFNIDFEQITSLKSGLDRYLVVAVRKKLVKFLTDIFNKSILNLTKIDLDKLAAVSALEKTQPQNGVVALVDCEDKNYDITLAYNGKFLLSEAVNYEENELQSEDFYQVSKDLNGLLDRMVGQINDSIHVDSFHTVYFFGDKFNRKLLNEFEKMSKSYQAVYLNPFQDLQLELDLESQNLVQQYSERFLYCLGMVV